MKLKALTATLALIAAQSVYAQQAPTTCPDVSAFRSTGVSSAYQMQPPLWVGVEKKNFYGTDNEWTFVVGEFDAQNATDALAQANAAISTLSYVSGPKQITLGVWMCDYEDQDQNISGTAISPALDDITHIGKFLRR